MKPKPKPKQELAIIPFPAKNIIRLAPASSDATQFLENECKKFGSILKRRYFYYLFISDQWDFWEVVEYLESYNETHEEPNPDYDKNTWPF